VNYKLYKELEITINEWWDSLPDAVQEALNKVYDKYYDKCEEKTND
jgi:TRAP-type C4-dicarboxylate transport system substrate-binding protein